MLGVNRDCLELVVASSREKYDLLTRIAVAYDAPRVERRCVDVIVIEKASGTAERALRRDWANETDPRPHVWSPAATTWLLLLRERRTEAGLVRDIVPAVAQSIIQSPLVIAMPQQMAEVLQRSRVRIGWQDILTLARDPEGWARFGKPWGPFRLGKTTPLISTSGLHALISLNNVAQTEDAPLQFLQGVESSVVHYADSVGTFLTNLRRADRDDRALEYVSAIAVEEKQVYDYNRGITDPCDTCPPEPKEKLWALYPKEGTLIADHPYAVLEWPDLSDAHRRAAIDFRDHLETPLVQSLFQQEGFRDHRRQAGSVLTAPFFDPSEPRTLYAPPIPSALGEMVNSWSKDIRKPANALMLLDVGPSMNDHVSILGATRLEHVKRAIGDALQELADTDAIGLRTFPTSDGRAYHEVLDIRELGPAPRDLSKMVGALRPERGNAALYASVRAAADRVRSGFMADRVNAVVVVSHATNASIDGLTDLLASLDQRGDERRVLVFTVALSSVAVPILRQIAERSGGVFYDATDPTDIGEGIRNALANL